MHAFIQYFYFATAVSSVSYCRKVFIKLALYSSLGEKIELSSLGNVHKDTKITIETDIANKSTVG